MRGQKITKTEKTKMRNLADAGVKREEIAKMLDKGYSTVCLYTKEHFLSNRKANKQHSVCVNLEDYNYIVNLAESKGISKRAALSEVVRLAKRNGVLSLLELFKRKLGW